MFAGSGVDFVDFPLLSARPENIVDIVESQATKCRDSILTDGGHAAGDRRINGINDHAAVLLPPLVT